MTEQRLCECSDGITGVITRVDGKSQIISRLLEMGMLPGEPVRIVRSGNPIILDVGETRLCVRPDQCGGILVTPVDPVMLGGLDSVYADEGALLETAK